MLQECRGESSHCLEQPGKTSKGRTSHVSRVFKNRQDQGMTAVALTPVTELNVGEWLGAREQSEGNSGGTTEMRQEK